jgi:hypothetical protein
MNYAGLQQSLLGYLLARQRVSAALLHSNCMSIVYIYMPIETKRARNIDFDDFDSKNANRKLAVH